MIGPGITQFLFGGTLKTFIYSVSILVLLSSCNSGGGGSSTPAKPLPAKPLSEQLEDAKSASDFSAKILPEKFTVVKANLSYEEEKERYTVGCKAQGEPSWQPYLIDPALRAGLVFKTQEGRSELLSTDTFQTLEKVIIQIEGQKIVTELNFLEGIFSGTIFTSIDQIFSRKPHITTTANYKEGATESDFSYVPNYTPEALQYFQQYPSSDSYLSCTISWSVDAPSQYSTDKIMYPVNGRQIVGYLKKRSEAGEVVCTKKFYKNDTKSEEVKLGLGRSETIEVVSNEIVNEATTECGGKTVFRSEKVVLDSGKVIRVDVQKVLEAPLR